MKRKCYQCYQMVEVVDGRYVEHTYTFQNDTRVSKERCPGSGNKASR